MQTIKHFKQQPKKLKLNGIAYKGYGVCEIPTRFGCLSFGDEGKEGMSEWFNYKGLTWIIDTKNHPW